MTALGDDMYSGEMRAFIGDVQVTQGVTVPYAAFIAPALLAVSAMNGAIYDSTWNVFFKLNYGKLYEGMLSTSLGPLDVALGEILYALLRGLAYATGFMIVMQLIGLNLSWTALLALPAVVLIAFGLQWGIGSWLQQSLKIDIPPAGVLPAHPAIESRLIM